MRKVLLKIQIIIFCFFLINKGYAQVMYQCTFSFSVYEDCPNKGESTARASVYNLQGNAPYTFLWINLSQSTQTATGLCYGTWTVSVTDDKGTSLKEMTFTVK